ncbi:MAG: YetF domain-containing protein [Acidobacteriota bacterium]
MDTNLWTDIVVPGIPVVDKILRPIIVYVFLIVGLRLAGKRELAQLNPFDLVVLLTISNTVQNAIIGNDNSVVGGLIGATTLLLVNWLVVRWTFRHPRIERLIEGTATVLMADGVIDQAAMEQELVSLDELASAARKQSYLSLDDVDRAVLEPGGSLTFAPRIATTRVKRHEEILAKLDRLHGLVEDIRREVAVRPGV